MEEFLNCKNMSDNVLNCIKMYKTRKYVQKQMERFIFIFLYVFLWYHIFIISIWVALKLCLKKP